MDLYQSFFLGIVQGLTEFLPISSSGHLVLLPKIFGWTNHSLAFDVILHLGTFGAVVIALFDDVKKIVVGFFSLKNKIWFYVLIAIVPAGLVGYFFADFIEKNTRSLEIVAVSLIFWGFFLWLAEKYSIKQKEKKDNLEKIGWSAALIIGIFQIISLIPGTSRSGITISAGLFKKLDKETAIRFSFLMSLPLIAAAGILKVGQLEVLTLASTEIISLVVGFLASLISGILAIKIILKIIKKYSFIFFVIYRILLGVIILIYIII